MRILITGGAGFIGNNFVRYHLGKYPDDEIAVLDKLTYAGRMENLKDVMDKITFIKGDICRDGDVKSAIKDGVDVIVNFAAESHVDRSIEDPTNFILSNIVGTHNLLEASRKYDVKRYLQISTDEVYGSIKEGSFKETDLLNPSSPYSASKASADLLVKSYFSTFQLPVLITRSSNNFGPFQFPEKLIPLFILNLMRNMSVPLYGDGLNVRDWIYVEDNCEAIDCVIRKGKIGEIYNIGSGNEKQNIQITRTILKELKKPDSLIQFVKDRPGHDLRYSLDIKKISKLGWKPKDNFEKAMSNTIAWYIDNKWWWTPLIK